VLGAVYLAGFVLALGLSVWMTRSSGGGALTPMAIAVVLLAACPLLVGGLALYAGHAEVELGDGELRAIERIGPFRWSRRRPFIHVSRLVVGHVPSGAGDDDKSPLAGLANEPGLAGILAEVRVGKPMTLAPGYRRAWLLALAQDLARRGKECAYDPLFDLPPPKTDVVESAVEISGFLERSERPAGSDVVVQHRPDGVTLIVPPGGVGRRTGGCLCLFIGLLFLGGALICLLAPEGIANADTNALGGFWICLICGLPPLLCAIDIGRRSVALEVAGETLAVTSAGPFGTRKRLWQRAELADIRTGPSSYEMNDRPFTELQIHLKKGAKFGFAVGRDRDELAFLATALRRSLLMDPPED
jgi:hypothetical protein